MDLGFRLKAGKLKGGLAAGRFAVRLSAATLALVVAMFALPSRASADTVTISLQENTGAITQVASGNGAAVFAGSYDGYVLETISALGSPALVSPGLQSSTFDISGFGPGAEILNIFVTEQGLTSPTGLIALQSTFDSSIFSGAIASLTEQTFIGDPGSIGTALGSASFMGVGAVSSVNNANLAGTYDETLEYTIKTNGLGAVAGSIAIAQAGGAVATPEPSTLLFLLLGVGGLFFVTRKRRLVLA
jgi:hypothetical protein